MGRRHHVNQGLTAALASMSVVNRGMELNSMPLTNATIQFKVMRVKMMVVKLEIKRKEPVGDNLQRKASRNLSIFQRRNERYLLKLLQELGRGDEGEWLRRQIHV
jgi:hypothetical protein